jgi:hypothetical protein
MHRRSIYAAGLGVMMAAAGCTGGSMRGSFRAMSLGGDTVYLDGNCGYAYYGDPSAPETSYILASVPLEQMTRGEVTDGLIIHLDLLWQPAAGKTPMDMSATNVSIRYIVFAAGEVGVYGGAGFALPASPPGGRPSTLTLWDASMELLDSTDGFVDLLSPARLTGRFTAHHDAERARQIRREATNLVSQALGRHLIVKAPGALFRCEKGLQELSSFTQRKRAPGALFLYGLVISSMRTRR